MLPAWAATAEINLDRFDEGQRWVLFSALNIMGFVGTLPVIRRIAGYLLAHCGMGLGTGVISSVIGLSDRSLRVAQALEPKQMLHSIRHPTGGHRKPKLRAEDAGVVARYLFEHPESEVSEVLAFVRARFGMTMDRLTLRRFVARFGLGCLRDESIRAAAPFWGQTIYGGAFLLMRQAVQLHRVAERCLGGLGSGKATRLVLSLFFKAVLGIARVFHFETLDDCGFAILTGGTTVLGRNLLGGLIRAAPVRGVLDFVRRTEPKMRRTEAVHVSIDEHAIARFTRKFQIKKGFHTIRNKHMRIEKVFCSFDVQSRKLLSVIVTRGNATLCAISDKLLRRLRPRARGASVRTILDAGAAANHTQLLALAHQRNQVTLVRAPRRPAYRKRWAAIPKAQWARHEEPGPFKAAAPKAIHIADIRMRVASEDVRTIVVREQRQRGKDRWHALWVFKDETTTALDILHEFRTRQHHEQRYRIMLHDAFVDTAASGYNKKSPNPRRPGFKQNSLTLYAWIAALATNALDDLTQLLPKRFLHAHPRTLRRWLFNVKADIFLGNGTLLVTLKPKRLHSLWLFLIRRANRHPVRIPWMDNRRLILSIDLSKPALPGPSRAEGTIDP